MKITALEEYGLRCLLCVAEHGEDEPVSAQSIAELEGLSLPYTQKLLRHLSSADLVRAKRGPNGGYYLARSAEEISLGEVLQELGGLLEMDEFCENHTGKQDVCANACSCTIRPVWSHISEFLVQTLEAIPLSVLVGEVDEVRNYLSEMGVASGDAPAHAGGAKQPGAESVGQ